MGASPSVRTTLTASAVLQPASQASKMFSNDFHVGMMALNTSNTQILLVDLAFILGMEPKILCLTYWVGDNVVVRLPR